MSTYREAILHARTGGTVYSRTRTVRFLTREEAEPIILATTPSRRTTIDEKTSKPHIKNGEIVVEEYADPNFRIEALGLFDVAGAEPVQFRPTAEDIADVWADAPLPPAEGEDATLDAPSPHAEIHDEEVP